MSSGFVSVLGVCIFCELLVKASDSDSDADADADAKLEQEVFSTSGIKPGSKIALSGTKNIPHFSKTFLQLIKLDQNEISVIFASKEKAESQPGSFHFNR